MNASSIKSSSWRVRLQNGSGYLKTIFLISTIVFGVAGALGLGLTSANAYPSPTFYSNFKTFTDAVECWLAYKLFCYYSRGDWFAPQAVRWMQAIGVFSLLRGSLFIWNNLLYIHLPFSSPIVKTVLCVQFILSQLLHNLIFGCVILFIAWILDEGRKMKEEQELTV